MANQIGDTVSKGNYFNVCTDETNQTFETKSFYTDSEDVIFADRENAENKVGAIKGITSDFNTTDAGYAASMTAVSKLNSSLGGLNFGTDGDGNYGYYRADGSLTPFNGKKQSKTVSFTTTSSDKNNGYKNVVVTFDDLIKVQSYTIDNFVDNFRVASIINGTVSGNTVNLKIRTADDGRNVSCTITAYGS